MSTLLKVVRIIRLCVFGLVALFSIIVLGLGAHMVSGLAAVSQALGSGSPSGFGVRAGIPSGSGMPESGFGGASGGGFSGASGGGFGGASLPFDFAALGIAVSLLTLFSLIPMLVLSFLNKVLWVNMVIVELGWLAVLWVLWLATAALATNNLGIIVFGCGLGGCGEMLGFQALAWLNWVLLFKYTFVLIVLTVVQHFRGNRVWKAPVYQVDFFAPTAYPAGGAPGVTVVYEQKTGQHSLQLPQQPQQYPHQQPQQTGQTGYPPPAPGANYVTTTYQNPPLANIRHQA